MGHTERVGHTESGTERERVKSPLEVAYKREGEDLDDTKERDRDKDIEREKRGVGAWTSI